MFTADGRATLWAFEELTLSLLSPKGKERHDGATETLVSTWAVALQNANCAYRFASFAAGDHPCTARSGEPSRPPVPIAGNTKKRRSNHNANKGCVN